MDDNPVKIADRLTEYVDELIDARSAHNRKAINGRTGMILTVLEKLRKAHKKTPLSEDLLIRIKQDNKRAAINLPDIFNNYVNICWDCYQRLGIHVTVDKRYDSTCPTCGWVQCSECGACRDPKHGDCKDRIYIYPKAPKQETSTDNNIPF